MYYFGFISNWSCLYLYGKENSTWSCSSSKVSVQCMATCPNFARCATMHHFLLTCCLLIVGILMNHHQLIRWSLLSTFSCLVLRSSIVWCDIKHPSRFLSRLTFGLHPFSLILFLHHCLLFLQFVLVMVCRSVVVSHYWYSLYFERDSSCWLWVVIGLFMWGFVLDIGLWLVCLLVDLVLIWTL